MLDSSHLREYVIRPVLKDMGYYSLAAENLLVMIAAHESKMGTYLKQVNGPALGIYQMEPKTAAALLEYASVYAYTSGSRSLAPEVDLAGNLLLQTALARKYLLSFEEALPHEEDLEGLADYAKKYWNTRAGKATPEDYLDAYQPHHI